MNIKYYWKIKYFTLFLIIYSISNKNCASLTVPKDEATATVVRFTNSLVPPLFQIYASNQTNTNVVLAPFGLAMSVAITMDCVHGATLEEISNLFKIQNKTSRQLLRSGFKSILKDFRDKDGQSYEELAGSYSKAFLTSSKTIPPSLTEQLSKNYFIDVITNNSIIKNFTSAQMLELRTDTGIMSHWRDFEKLVVYTYLSHSSSAPFFTISGDTINIPMIPLIGFLKAGRLPNLDCQGAELLFENKKVSLLLLMPDDIGGLASLQTKLFTENFFDVLDSLPQQETKIMIPQLSTVTNNLELIPFLKLLGISKVFDVPLTTSSSSHVSNKNKTSAVDVYVQSIKQNAFFSTSYTALNSIGSMATKLDENSSNGKPTNRNKRESVSKITFDKPFLFFLIHRESGLILVTGQITHPKLLPNQ